MADLNKLRQAIDHVDQQLLTLLNERAGLAQEVGHLKQAEGSAVFRPEREAEVIRRLQQSPELKLQPASVGHIWREIMSACRALEAKQRVAYLGPEGTFSQEAALTFFGSSIEEVPCTSLDEVFRLTASGGADFGMVPLENSTEGVITRSLDLLLTTPAHMVGEVSLAVQHHLMRQRNDLQEVEVVLAHPQALAQCQQWLTQHLPHAERRAVSSNAEGARMAAEQPTWAAIAGKRAATLWGLHVVAQAIQDDSHNRTRFGVICLPTTLAAPAASGHDRTSLVVSVPNRPGAVHDLLTPLKTHGVSMTRFESRPARSGQWDYVFYIDIEGHPSQPPVAAASHDLQAMCAFYKVLGTFAAAAT